MKFKAKGFYSRALVVSLVSSSLTPYSVYASESGRLTNSQFDTLQRETNFTVENAEIIDPTIDTNSSELVSVIVELIETPASVDQDTGHVPFTAYKAVKDEHIQFKDFFKGLVTTDTTDSGESNPNLKASRLGLEYFYALNGISLTIPGTEVEKLLESGVVKKIWNDVQFKVEDPTITSDIKETKSTMMDSLGIVNVDKLHDEGITGKTATDVAIKVGVIDTGIDYNHPDLTEVYSGARVDNLSEDETLGWDFVDDDSDPMETTYQDWLDAYGKFGESGAPEVYGTSTYYTTHGTHVSGTIAGNRGSGSDTAVLGVAPDVDLYSYRALGPYGAGAASWIVGAIDKSVEDGMDVVNMSLGATVNNPLYVTSSAVNNAVLSGVTVCVAAGNNGSEGEKSLGSPGTAPLAITVGASTFNIAVPTVTTSFVKADGTVVNIDKSKMMASDFSTDVSTIVDKEVVYVGLGSETEVTAVDLTGKVALITRGTYALVDKIKNAKNAGAVGVVMINNAEGEIESYSGNSEKYCPTFQVSKAVGEEFVNYLSQGGTMKVSFTNPSVSVAEGDDLASFSSRGPVGLTYDIKPDVVAPGVSIFSSVTGEPTFDSSGVFTGKYDYKYAYERESGTSMATPHVAGIAALILSAHPEYTPADVKAVLSNTAVALKDKTLSVFEQGAGRVDAYAAVKSDIMIKSHDTSLAREYESDLVSYTEKLIDVDRGSLNFGVYSVEGDKNITKNLSIQNNGTTTKNYTLRVDYHDPRTGISNTEDILSAEDNGVVLTVPNTLTVEAGKTTTFDVSLVAPKTAKQGRYEGYVYFTDNQSGKTYPVPFAYSTEVFGIKSFSLSKFTTQSGGEIWEYTNKAVGTAFSFETSMRSVTWYMEKEDGEDIGFLGVLDASSLQQDHTYFINSIFGGAVYNFVNNTSNEGTITSYLVPTGFYNIVMESEDVNGNIHVERQPLYIDNTQAKLTVTHNGVALRDGVYEVSDSDFVEDSVVINGTTYNDKAYWLDVTVNDTGVDSIKDKYGLDVNQGDNTLYFYAFTASSGNLKRYGSIFPLNDNGQTKFGIEPDDFILNGKEDVFLTSFANADLANNVTYKNFAFVKKGTPYVDVTIDKEQIALGDTLSVIVNINNVTNFNKFISQYGYNGTVFSFTGAEFIANSGATQTTSTLATTVSGKGTVQETLTVTADKLVGNTNTDVNLLKLNFKVVSDEYYYSKALIKLDVANYRLVGSQAVTPLKSYLPAYTDFKSVNTRVRGILYPEGISKYDFASATLTATTDLTKVGAEVYAIGKDGKRYDGVVINAVGEFEVRGIPADGSSYYIYTEVPGHLATYQEIFSGIDLGNGLSGHYINIGMQNSSYGGDVNDDGVVDILDAEEVMKVYKFKSTDIINPADINRDGVVDSIDLGYVKTNFGKTDITTKTRVQDSFGSKTLDYYLRRVGF